MPRTLATIVLTLAAFRPCAAQCPGWDSSVGSTGAIADALALAVFDAGGGPALHAGVTLVKSWYMHGVASWNGSAWKPLGLFNDPVRTLAVCDDGSGPALYAGGEFEYGGPPYQTLHHVARWNGAAWEPLGSGGLGLFSHVYVLASFDEGAGNAVFAGGHFEHVAGTILNHLARWDGTAWSSVGGGVSGPSGNPNHVGALCVHDDGSGPALYVGGDFERAGSVLAANVARWDGTSFSPLGAGTDGKLWALATFDDGSGTGLYAAGSFTTAGGQVVHGIARWDGAGWSGLGAGVASSGPWTPYVRSLAVFDDGSGPALYVAGFFDSAGGVPARGIARWDGAAWSALASGVEPGSAYALAVFDDGADGAPDLYVGGTFASAGGLPAQGAAAWRGCTLHATPICAGDGSQGAPCPCGNGGLPGHGCDNSTGSGGALLAASGTSWPDALVLASGGEPAGATSIFVQGDLELAAGAPFGDGLRCIGGSLKRLYVVAAAGGVAMAPGPGDSPITQRSASLGDPIAHGSTRRYQVFYRDPEASFCPAGGTFNASSGLAVAW